MRSKWSSHPSETHSGCGGLLLVSNDMPSFHFWCPPAGAHPPGGPISIHRQLQMPMFGFWAIRTPYSPPLPSQRRKKMNQEKWNQEKDESGKWKFTFAEKVLVARHCLGHFPTPFPISFYFLFLRGWGDCASDAKNGIDWNSVSHTIISSCLSYFPIPSPFLVETQDTVFDLHK